MSWFEHALVVVLSIAVASAGARQGAQMDSAHPTIGEVEKILTLPECEETRRGAFAGAVVRALEIVGEFAARYGWGEKRVEPFFRAVEIYETRDELWTRILDLHGLEDVPVPTDALTAALEEGILLAVVPEEAERARPEYFNTLDDWTRALAHEILHRLHIRILDGEEERMGDPWFFEGFAIFGSGQRLGAELEPETFAEAMDLTRMEGRGSYAGFAAAFRFFAQRVPLPELVAHAGDKDFEDWLRKRVG